MQGVAVVEGLAVDVPLQELDVHMYLWSFLQAPNSDKHQNKNTVFIFVRTSSDNSPPACFTKVPLAASNGENKQAKSKQ